MQFAWFKEITQDKNGHTVAKDLFKALAFFAGLVYLFLMVPAIILLTPTHIVLPLEIGVTLLGSGLSLEIVKEVKGYYQRKTADSENNALATPASVEPPATNPELMPQVP
ncbi:hypothetical protein K3G63_06610 [Hymenobacter sp. HSC-4F20]|uniref:hypothetical protein n=1 Tax=Hymenobacter sp. HSC-4F20 TaxID=2864135 RepID=UPI001C73337E|nr:hypothetical protein [Hymenobacter sp. HSC-4F20]MBX0290102.1 hypothetical protein [Hymenobacter sp. HSC-4F20]